MRRFTAIPVLAFAPATALAQAPHPSQAHNQAAFDAKTIDDTRKALGAVTAPAITTRIKIGQSSNVYALVKADGKFHVAAKEIKVTFGGREG